MADTLGILLANISGQLTPQPGDGLQGDRVPAPQGVDCQGDEGDPLPGTPLLVLPRFASVGALDCTAAILGGASDQSILEGIDDGDIEGAILRITSATLCITSAILRITSEVLQNWCRSGAEMVQEWCRSGAEVVSK